MVTTVSPQQRALNFGAYTRQHIQTLGSQSGTANSHIEYEVPKARLLQAINLLVEVTLKKASASTTTLNDLNAKMELYNVIRRMSIDYNNGFSPVVASGKDIAIVNMLRVKSDTVIPTCILDKSMCTITAPTASAETDDKITLASATDVKYYFMLEVPVTLNDRDPSGLVLAQNGQTLINFSIDIADSVNEIPVDSVKITPQLVTFSIPPVESAFPDLSVLKVLDSRKESFTGGGSNLIKLPTGMIYRKVIIYLEDENGNPMTPTDITSNIELLLNTADIPYSINPQMLRLRTTTQTGGRLPEGYYALDFSCQGTNPNYGGSRDYIDAEQITTFEMRFTTTKAGKITLISEKISRLIASK